MAVGETVGVAVGETVGVAMAIGIEIVWIKLAAIAIDSASLAAFIDSSPGLAKTKPRKSLTLGLGLSL